VYAPATRSREIALWLCFLAAAAREDDPGAWSRMKSVAVVTERPNHSHSTRPSLRRDLGIARRRSSRDICALGLLLSIGCGSTNSPARDASACPSKPTHRTTTTPAIYTPDDAAQLCATLQSCFPMEFPNVWTSAMECATGGGSASGFIPLPGDLTADAPSALDLLPRAIDPAVIDFYNCVLNHGGDCALVAQCLLLDRSPNMCSAGKGDGLANGTCTGSPLHGCTADGNPFAVDCGRLGAACVDATGLSHGSCDWALCPPGIGLCDGTSIVKCTVSGEAVDLFDCCRLGSSFHCTTVNGFGKCSE
jgi:hypothetical protein